ncbi:MAG TPA: filamentous hemagglutinin N-terminal domain-containing protein, partial [Phormidium sp.]
LNVELQEINGHIESKFYLINKQSTEKFSPKPQKKDKILACAFFLSSLTIFNINSAFAQPIVPANDGTNTIVNPQGNRFDITGGQRSSDGANLFHTFTRFGLDSQQIANFLSQPNIRNILARVNGGEISYINGLIQITGGNSNLFLMNPSGVVFGSNAGLNVPAAFTATTANGIGFGNSWFNATGNNNYAALVGDPNAFAFTMQQPGAIINSGNLAVGLGQDLNLLAGTVINTGTLTAPQGNITVAGVPGTSLVRLSQPGFLLSLEIQPIGNSVTQPNSFDLPIASLPQMLTGGNGSNATGVSVNKDGSVELTGSGIRIPTEGNTAIVAGKIDVSGEKGGNLNILADKIGVTSANINASGTKDGGNVRIGGDYKGQGNLLKASRVLISNDSTIKVDSSSAGNGGKVIIWSDKATAFYGNISAKGGNNSGDGGFVEVSSADVLIFKGNVDASAPNGKTGTLLLDPSSLNIIDILTGPSGSQDNNLTTDNQILSGDPDQL